MSYKLVVADVDGTIIAPRALHSEKLSERLIHAVAAAAEKGVWVSLASARSLDWVEGLVSSLNLIAPLILDNGARIWDCAAKEYIFQSFVSEQKIPEIVAVMKDFSFPVHAVANNSRVTFVADNSPALTRVTKMMVLHITPIDAETVYKRLSAIDGIQVTKSISGVNPTVESIHITAADARKDIALAYVAKRLGIQKEAIIGIGDSYNDIEFLQSCGLKVAMGNSVPAVLAIADFVAPPYTEDGVAAVIEKFILGK